MMRGKIFVLIPKIIIIVLFIGCGFATAQPVITSVSGTFAHKRTIELTGSDFGLKFSVAPLHWDDGENKVIDNPEAVKSEGGYSEVWSPPSCGDWRPMYKNSNSNRWIGSPHARSTKVLGGGHKDNFVFGNQDCRNVLVTVAASVPQKDWFIIYYFRMSPDWPRHPSATGQGGNVNNGFDSEYIAYLNRSIDSSQTSIAVHGKDATKIGPGDILKIDREKMRVASISDSTIHVIRGVMNTSPKSHSQNTRIYVRGCLYNVKVGSLNIGTTAWSGREHWQMYGIYDFDENNDYAFEPLGQWPACSGCGRDEGLTHINNKNDSRKEWKQVEIRLRDANGWAQSLIDNLFSKNCKCSKASNEVHLQQDIRSVSLGTYFRYFHPEDTSRGIYHTNDNAWTYLDDIYIDNTMSRVMLANNQRYERATIVEPQIPSHWDNTSITVQVNLGRFPDAGTAYLFVFDADNVHNSIGYPITINGMTHGTGS